MNCFIIWYLNSCKQINIFFSWKRQRANQMCLTVCTGLLNSGDAFSITSGLPAAPPADQAATDAANALTRNSRVGATNNAGNEAVCLYDFLLIAGGREATTGFTADRYCGGALNPSPAGGPNLAGLTANVEVCSK
jgi:hypothetical protein